MTDNEIIKALECCANWESDKSCEDCPANTYGFGCANKRAKHSLDLINRQKAEIERLQVENKIKSQKRANIFELIENYDKGRIAGAKELAEQVKMAFYYEYDELIPSVMADEIDNLVKEMESKTE